MRKSRIPCAYNNRRSDISIEIFAVALWSDLNGCAWTGRVEMGLTVEYIFPECVRVFCVFYYY